VATEIANFLLMLPWPPKIGIAVKNYIGLFSTAWVQAAKNKYFREKNEKGKFNSNFNKSIVDIYYSN
jgi:hypothetical protein